MPSLTPRIGLRPDHFHVSFLDQFRARCAGSEGALSGGERPFEEVAERGDAALEGVLRQGGVADDEAVADGSPAVVAAADGEEFDGLLRRPLGQLGGGGSLSR
jgi:hypothetical protein